ncbi:exonuclease domain-containing protein [Nocardioides sp. AX2bis]|uniref:exonuclease domain-containing protein n=1 Tax=Nocardioides sp. AX2bis TaxID=2653157 RepID=UPI0012F2475E|nr:exonuclease domain-containing protein [Nocardioides sp. AX2bis]VXC26246.1 putative DNA-directed DNA polymerase [Nocardioides sp. AX2bis]
MGLIDRLRKHLRSTGRSGADAVPFRDTAPADHKAAPVRRSESPVAPAVPTRFKPAFPYMHPRFAVVDVETTGLSATSDRILEVAVVTTDTNGRILDTWATRLNPQGPVGATHIHGITDDDVVHAPLFADIIEDLNARLAGAALAGHNARFDLAFLRAEYARSGWQMPFVPALCTLEASTHHLPHLPRRRLVDVCAAVGLPPHQAHSALHDATATAALMAAFLHPGRPPRHVDTDLPNQGHAVVWPTAGEGAPLPVPTGGGASGRRLSDRARRNMATATTAPATKPLVHLISRFSLLDARDEGAPERTVAYLEKLAEVLEDGVLDPSEAASLAEVAATYDLATGHVDDAHLAFVRALARKALADGKLTRAERTELTGVAEALRVPTGAITAVLAEATNHHYARHSANLAPLPEDWAHGEPLRVGDRVVFTGCDPNLRERLEKQSEAAGVRVMNGVAKTTAVLVTDGSMAGTKTRKAAEIGTRVVDPGTYAHLLHHLQPAAAAHAPRPHNRAAKQAGSSPVPAVPAAGSEPGPEPAGEQGPEAGRGPAAEPGPGQSSSPTPAELRAWGRANGWVLGQRGRLPQELWEAYEAAHRN